MSWELVGLPITADGFALKTLQLAGLFEGDAHAAATDDDGFHI